MTGRFGEEVELLERQAEFELMRVALDAAGLGSGRVMLICGEAGIGKTTLVRSFAEANRESALFLVGVCDDLFTPRPLSPLWDIGRDEPAISAGLEAGNRDAVYEAVFDLMERSIRPTVFVIEDAHWADEASLDLVRHVGRRVHDTHGLLILTYRDDELSIDHPLRSVLGDLPPASVDRLLLSPLSIAAIDLLSDEPGVAERIHGWTGGNPFFVTELLASGGHGLPSSVIDSVTARVARLSKKAKALVELVSVVPGRVELTLVEASLSEWDAALDEAERLALLEVRGSHLSFRHELTRRAVERAVSAGRRIELNRTVLSHLLTHGADSSLIVHHAIEAGDASALLEHAPVAAEGATALASHREAYGYYETLRPVYHRLPPAERAEVLHGWSVSASVVNQLGDAVSLIDEAIGIWRDLDHPMALGSALRWRSRLAWLQGERALAETHADEAVAVLEPLGSSAELAHAYSTQAQLAMLANMTDRAVERAGLAIKTARPLGEDRIVAHAMVNMGSSWTIGTYPENAEPIREAIDFARRRGFREELVRGTINYAWGALLARDLGTAERRAIESAETAEGEELAAYSQYAQGTLALIRMMKGEWPDAEEIARSITGRSRTGPTTEILLGTILGTLLARRGDAGADALLEEAWKKAQSTGELQRSGLVSAARAELAWIAGDHASIPDLIGPDLDRAVEVGLTWVAADLFMWGRLGGHDIDAPHQLPPPYELLLDGDWRSAAAEWAKLGMPYERAVTLGQGDEEAVLEAVSSLDALGAKPVADALSGQASGDGRARHSTRAGALDQIAPGGPHSSPGRGDGVGRRGLVQPGDRRSAVHLAAYRRPSCLIDPHQAGRLVASRGS